MRVTDHKTGRVRADRDVVIGGGKTLQPVLYALAAERILGQPIEEGRLYYCTAAGGYEERVVTIDAAARRAMADCAGVIGQALDEGFLPAAPGERECDYCDYRRVCGPYEHTRVEYKAAAKSRLRSTGRIEALAGAAMSDALAVGSPAVVEPQLHGRASAPPPADQAVRDRIRNDLETTLIIEAAAGTGKTTALVSRIVAVVASGRTELDKVVAVTFTEKAAGELKLRLRAEIERARHEDPDPQARARLDSSLEKLEEARIGTIHSFCADLLRERPVEAAVDPMFEVAAEDASGAIFNAAFDRWFEGALAAPGEGLRRILRRPDVTDREGPRPLLRAAAQELLEWRDFDAAWRHEPFERDREIDALVDEIAALGALGAEGDPDDWLRRALEETQPPDRRGDAARGGARARLRRAGSGAAAAVARQRSTLALARRGRAVRAIPAGRNPRAKGNVAHAAERVSRSRGRQPGPAAARRVVAGGRDLPRIEGTRRSPRFSRSAADRAQPGARQ